MTLHIIAKQNVSEEVFQQFLNAIMSGEWPVGTRTPSETKLSKELGVSRVTVRNAFQRLEGMKLVERRQGSGTYVSRASGAQVVNSITPMLALGDHDLKDLMEFREIFDSEIAQRAATRADSELIGSLKNAYRLHLEAIESGDIEAAAKYDTLFHFSIAKASGNRMITEMYEYFLPVFQRNMVRIITIMGPEEGKTAHRKIIEEIEKKDDTAARELMRAHVHRTVIGIGDEEALSSAFHKPEEEVG